MDFTGMLSIPQPPAVRGGSKGRKVKYSPPPVGKAVDEAAGGAAGEAVDEGDEEGVDEVVDEADDEGVDEGGVLWLLRAATLHKAANKAVLQLLQHDLLHLLVHLALGQERDQGGEGVLH